MAKWTKVGSVLKRKEGNGTYLKIDVREGSNKLDSITLKSGTILNIQDPRTRPNITEEDLAKIPDFVKFEVFLAPPRE